MRMPNIPSAAGLVKKIARKMPSSFPVRRVRRNLFFAEARHGLPDELMLFSENTETQCFAAELLACSLVLLDSISTSIWPGATTSATLPAPPAPRPELWPNSLLHFHGFQHD